MTEFAGMDAEFIAHVRKEAGGSYAVQTVTEHLEGTARLAGDFAEAFGNRDWGELLGWWHDLGKFTPAWQKHIRKGSGYNDEAFHETSGGNVNHSTAGAILAFERFSNPIIARLLSYGIAGHHAGLPDWEPDEAGGDLVNRLFDTLHGDELRSDEMAVIKEIEPAAIFLKKPLPRSAPMGVVGPEEAKVAREHTHLWIRMLYSCLVDADFLDTEAFMEHEKAATRGHYPLLHELKTRFDDFMDRMQASAPCSVINRRRREILETCRQKASSKPGFFSLNVPTGGGKTLSAMAFALGHALTRGKKRIVMAIPYTSIIEQTAAVYAEVFGTNAIVEHHSNIDPEKETTRNLLASENWDAPIIVTTNVQLFESLFASRSSACRKLHNLVDSVVILDEAQMLPPSYLRPILSALRGLVERFGATVVLCTATQPALEGRIGAGKTDFSGLSNVTPIIEDPIVLASDFRRVSFSFPRLEAGSVEWSEIAKRLVKHDQILCVVNTKRSCRELHTLMPEGTIHLSAFMCGEERSDVIAEIKEKLKMGEKVRVISTQLVEAGVDIDFPVVYRAMAGLDSIAQAAGRCNREGRLNTEARLGQVIVFDPPVPSPPGHLRKCEDAFREVLRANPNLDPNPNDFHEYFRKLFAAVNDFDRPKFQERVLKECTEAKLQFRTLARYFHLIDDQAQKGLIVSYRGKNAESDSLIDRLQSGYIDRNLLRRLQRFTVSVPICLLAIVLENGMVAETNGFFVQTNPALYKKGIGLDIDAEWAPESLIK